MITKTIQISMRIVKLCDEKEHPVLRLLESEWKLQQHDQSFPMEGKPLYNK